MKKIYIVIILALFALQAHAQLAKADRLFENWDYFEAAKLYEKEAAKTGKIDIYYKLGECYRKMNWYKEEQVAYDKVSAGGPYSKPEFYLHYGQVLRNNGNYFQAEIAFDAYAQLMPSDPRGKFFSNSIEIIAEDHNNDQPIKIRNVTALNSINSEFSPVIYKDGIVFTSSRKTPSHDKTYGWTGEGYLQLYFAKKGNNDTTFTDITTFGGKIIDQKYHDGPACFSKNYDTLYTSRVERDLKGEEKKTLKIERNKIFSSVMKEGDWTKVVPFPFNNDTFSVANPFLTSDGSRIYFVSDMPGGFGETDIYYCDKAGAGWSKPINMGPNINTFNREKFPTIDTSGNFYFASDGYQGFGGLDICVALNKGGELEKALPLKSPFNSSTDDYAITFLKNGKTGYFCSNRTGGQGDDDIYYFNLLNDNVDSSLVTSIYTIGYKPKPPVEVVAVIVNEDSIAMAHEPIAIKKLIPIELRIYFDFDKYNIRIDAINRLDSVVKYMQASPKMTIVIDGHTDNVGTPEYNMVLSNKRDNAVIKYLYAKGIDPKRVKATGYGLTKMVNRCGPGVICSDEEEQLNRRVEFHFTIEKTVIEP